MAKFNNVVLTKETIQTTRQWFADNAQACIDEAVSGAIKVNNLVGYIADQQVKIDEYLSGVWDHTFTFLQRAHYIQTGESVALHALRS